MTGTNGYPAGTVGGWLEERRHQQFVGRVAELDLFRSALEAADPGPRAWLGLGDLGSLRVPPPAYRAGAIPFRGYGMDVLQSPVV